MMKVILVLVCLLIGNLKTGTPSRPRASSNNDPAQRYTSKRENTAPTFDYSPENSDGEYEEGRGSNSINEDMPYCQLGKVKTARTLNEIYGFVQGVSEKYKDFTKLTVIGKSYKGLPIFALKIHDDRFRKFSTIVVEFGIHAREWASTESAVFLIDQLVNEQGWLVQKLQWFIVPVLNPDGYNYSLTVDDMWRKNLRPGNNKCPGVDLNRNFGDHWSEVLSEDACVENYSGTGPFSEPETQAMRDFMESIKTETITAYVGVHSCAQCIMYPYGYTNKPPPSVELLRKVGQKMADNMYKVRAAKYSVQQAYRLAVQGGAVGGGSDDYMFEHLNIPLVFTIELGDAVYVKDKNYDYCFHPHTYLLMYRLTKECHAALMTLADHIVEEGNKPKKEELNQAPRHHPSYIPTIVWLYHATFLQ